MKTWSSYARQDTGTSGVIYNVIHASNKSIISLVQVVNNICEDIHKPPASPSLVGPYMTAVVVSL